MRQLFCLGLEENDYDMKTKKKRMFLNRIHRFSGPQLEELNFSKKETTSRIKKQNQKLDQFCDKNAVSVHIHDLVIQNPPELQPYVPQRRPIKNSLLEKKMQVEFLGEVDVARVDIETNYDSGHSKKLKEMTFTTLMSDLRMMTPTRLRKSLDQSFFNGLVQNIDNLITKFSRRELFPGQHEYLKKRVNEVIECAPEILRNQSKARKDLIGIKIQKLEGLTK